MSTTSDASGRVTTDTGKTDPVKVVNVDTTNNTMAVDGGEWTGTADQVYSANTAGTANAGYEWSNAFNGSLTGNGANGGNANVPYAVFFDPPLEGTIEAVVNVAGILKFSTAANPDINDTENDWFNVNGNTEFVTTEPVTAIGVLTQPQVLGIRLNGKLLVDGTVGGETKVEYQTTGGTGTIAAGGINVSNKTITLTAAGSGDARWIGNNKAGTVFRVATDTKAAVSTTAYLKFDAGGAVTGYQATPVEPRAMDNKVSPKLTFPAMFSNTGSAPDTEFSDENAYIKTSVQLKNISGNSAIKTSNPVVPSTGFRSIGPGETAYNENTLREMLRQNLTLDLRVASKTASNIQSVLSEFDIKVDNYLTEEIN